MPGVVWIVFGVAFLNDLMADLEQRLLKLRYALAGFDFHVHGSIAEFVPELGIRDQPARFFARESGAFCDAAERVIHRPVQIREERCNLLPAAFLLISEGVLCGADRNIDQEIAVNRGPAEVEVQLSLKRDRVEKLIGQKDFLSPQFNQRARQTESNSGWMHIEPSLYDSGRPCSSSRRSHLIEDGRVLRREDRICSRMGASF